MPTSRSRPPVLSPIPLWCRRSRLLLLARGNAQPRDGRRGQAKRPTRKGCQKILGEGSEENCGREVQQDCQKDREENQQENAKEGAHRKYLKPSSRDSKV